MSIRHIIPVLALVLSAVPARGQLLKDIDMLLKNNQARQVYDTTYIYRPQERFLIRTQSLFSTESLVLEGQTATSGGFAIDGSSLFQYRQTIGIGYRSIVLDVGFIPGKQKSAGLELKINGNRIGVSAGGSISFGMTGAYTQGGVTQPLPEMCLVGLHAYFNTYYAFNGKRFSMPAATNQNYRQRRSAGSPLATLSAQIYGTAPNPDILPDSPVSSILTSLLGLGGGYGYNWVPTDHWLIHLSLTETVGFLNNSVIRLHDESQIRFRQEVPVFVTAGNAAVLYYWRKWYFGLHVKADHLLFYGKKDLTFSVNRFNSVANLTVGVRF